MGRMLNRACQTRSPKAMTMMADRIGASEARAGAAEARAAEAEARAEAVEARAQQMERALAEAAPTEQLS